MTTVELMRYVMDYYKKHFAGKYVNNAHIGLRILFYNSAGRKTARG
jgi:hypothetical protein